MICQTCKDQVHGKCQGGTWCDCRHRSRPDIHVLIAAWHDAPADSEAAQMALHEFLGMTWEEYVAWAHDRPDL